MLTKYRPEDVTAFFICIAAAFMRFYNYDQWSLSNDELSAMSRLRFNDFSTMIREGVILNDMHPMGVQSFLWIWTKISGISETAFRFPFVVAGSLAVFVFYKIASMWFNKTSALFSTSLFAFLGFPILYSQLARPYAFGMLFTLLMVYGLTGMIRNQPFIKHAGLRYYIIFILAGAATMYTHYFAFLVTAISGVTGFFFIQKKNWLQYSAAGVLMFLLYIPNYPVFLHQFSIGGLGGDEGWLGPPEADAIFKYVLYGFNNDALLLAGCTLIFFTGIFYFRRSFRFNKYHAFAFALFIIPALIAYYYSIFFNPVFQYSILVFSFPFILMIMFSFLPDLEWNLKKLFQVIAFSILVTYSTVVNGRFYQKQHFPVFLEVADKIADYYKSYEGDIVVTVNVIDPFYIDYYLGKNEKPPAVDLYKSVKPNDFITLINITDTSKTNFIVHGWSNTYNAPETELIILKNYPYVVASDSFYASGVTLYSKNPEQGKLLLPDFEHLQTFDNADPQNILIRQEGENNYLHLDSIHEFSPGNEFKLSEIKLYKGSTVGFSLKARTHEIPEGIQLVFEIQDRDGKNKLWRSMPLQGYYKYSPEWFDVYGGYRITENILPEDVIKYYLWNPGHATVDVDSIHLQVINNQNRKPKVISKR